MRASRLDPIDGEEPRSQVVRERNFRKEAGFLAKLRRAVETVLRELPRP